MSDTLLSGSALEIAHSIPPNDIPVKLRCAICNKFAVDSFRLPCCDQSICSASKESLPDTCPVCDHTPLSSTDCKPNKTLRLTVKAWLRKEEQKRLALSSAVSKQTVSAPSEPPAEVLQPLSVKETSAPPSAGIEVEQSALTENGPAPAAASAGLDVENNKEPEQLDVTQPDLVDDGNQAKDETHQSEAASEEPAAEQTTVDRPSEEAFASGPLESSWSHPGSNLGNMPMHPQNGYEMGWNNGFNPMFPFPMNQPMGQNMQDPNWNGFSMGMGMMPAMGQGPGMFNGFNGGESGMGFDGGFNGGGWNRMADFNAPGYYSNSGHDQQSQQGYFGQMQQQHSMPRNNFPTPHNRFNNGGRGGFVSQRGGFNNPGFRNFEHSAGGVHPPQQFPPGIDLSNQTLHDGTASVSNGVEHKTDLSHIVTDATTEAKEVDEQQAEPSQPQDHVESAQSIKLVGDGIEDGANQIVDGPMPIANVADMDMYSNMNMNRSRMFEHQQQHHHQLGGAYNWQQNNNQSQRQFGPNVQNRQSGFGFPNPMGPQYHQQQQLNMGVPINAPTGPSGKSNGHGLGVEGAPTGPRALREGGVGGLRGGRAFGRGGGAAGGSFGANGYSRQQSRDAERDQSVGGSVVDAPVENSTGTELRSELSDRKSLTNSRVEDWATHNAGNGSRRGEGSVSPGLGQPPSDAEESADDGHDGKPRRDRTSGRGGGRESRRRRRRSRTPERNHRLDSVVASADLTVDSAGGSKTGGISRIVNGRDGRDRDGDRTRSERDITVKDRSLHHDKDKLDRHKTRGGRDRERGGKDYERDREREKEKEKDRERDRVRDRGTTREDRREKTDSGKGTKDRTRDRHHNAGSSSSTTHHHRDIKESSDNRRDKERDRVRDRERDHRDREREHRDREKENDKEKDKERGGRHHRSSSDRRGRDRDKERDRTSRRTTGGDAFGTTGTTTTENKVSSTSLPNNNDDNNTSTHSNPAPPKSSRDRQLELEKRQRSKRSRELAAGGGEPADDDVISRLSKRSRAKKDAAGAAAAGAGAGGSGSGGASLSVAGAGNGSGHRNGAAPADPHELERQARNRERLAREEMRRKQQMQLA